MKILITGGAGFIGSNLAEKLSSQAEIFIVDDLSMGKKENLRNVDNVVFYEESVLNKDFMKRLLNRENFDYIFHLAAVASVADSVKRPQETHEVNFMSTLIILEILRKMSNRNLKKFVFSSSAAVYGDDKILPKKENSNIQPLSPYAIDKFASEKYVLTYNNLYDIPTTAVRFFNVFGPNQNPTSPYSGVISIILDKFKKNLNGEMTKFSLFGDGKQTRDFIYIDDVINALWIVAISDSTFGKTFNVGTGNETSINDILIIISKFLKMELNIERMEERDGDIRNSVADINELEKLGFVCSYTIETGLKNYLMKLKLV
ncbi:NAD-dependent epimerase/dehydratase family protein [Vagococcus carniphilus]|uniref:Epimerase n=1 Tax=Vagococcus carniphilus TaxID=218144 RepID=A0A430B928_9ENTE|nr:epimerase [Vagococcus carniphilus]